MPGPKKAQRTKGNVKPSSSSQAAQLLAASGHTTTGFIGFSNQPAFVPVSETFDEAEAALDGDFRLVLRKLSKRDAVTKIKALQEFTSLCSSKDEDSVKAIVPFWPRIYNKVAIDVDHKVRELSQKATASLATRAGKSMAPHLKSIMGMWLVSMCDTYPTVASAANQAFTSRFPEAKQTEAIRFCLAEIMECLSKNILTHNKQTLSDPQTTSDEDMEAKYQRVVTSSLQGLRKVLLMLPLDSVSSSMSDHMTSLLESSAFWKHSKSSVPSVKGGMLGLLSAICQHCPSASAGTISKISPFVFSHLDCSEPSIVSYAWEATLAMVSAHEECWQHVNWQKAVWPKLKSVLESGFSGQAGIVAPCLLPLLSKIPEINFDRLFKSFQLGLNQGGVYISTSNLNAMVKSFQECMQFAIKRLAIEGKSTEIKNLLLGQMLTVVLDSLKEQNNEKLSKTELYCSLNVLLSSVLDTDVQKCFWSNLSEFTITRLQSQFAATKKSSSLFSFKTPTLFERLKSFMKGLLLQEYGSDGSRHGGVRFFTGEHEEKTGFRLLSFWEEPSNKERAKLSPYAESFVGDILVSVFKMATIDEKVAPEFMYLFSQLVVIGVPDSALVRLNSKTDSVCIRAIETLSLDPGRCLTEKFGKDVIARLELQLSSILTSTGQVHDYTEFVVRHLLPLLFYAESKGFYPLQCCAATSFFAFLRYVETGAALEILSSVIQGASTVYMTSQLVMNTVLSHRVIPACQKLWEAPSFGKCVEQLLLAATRHKGSDSESSDHAWDMLTEVISDMESDGNLHVSQPCLDAIMSCCLSILSYFLERKSHDGLYHEMDDCLAVLKMVGSLLPKQRILTHPLLGELVVNLLRLNLQPKPPIKESTFRQQMCMRTGYGSCKEKICSPEELWTKGFGLVMHSKSEVENQDLVHQMCRFIRESVSAGSTAKIMDRLERIKRIVMLFISSIISPWEEGGWEIDSRLVIPIISPWDENILEPNKLTLDLDMEIDDFDMDPVSAVVDDLLTKENHQMQNFREICNYMYISGSSQVLFGNPESHGAETKYLPINTELLWAHYNLSVLILFLNLLQRADYGEESDQDVFVLSDAQMACLKNLCGKFVLLSAAEKMNDNQCKKELSACMPDLHSGLVKCLNTLTCMQLSKLVDYASMEDSTKPSSLDILGMTQLLQIIIDKNEVPRKKSMALKSNIYKLRCSFMSSCELPAIVTSELKKFLEDSGVSETCLNNAFSLPSQQQEPMDVGNEHIMIKSISLCLSGFFEMNLGYKALNSDCKTEHFQKLSMITNRLKEKNVHLLNSSDSMPVPVHLLELNVCIARSLKHLMVPSSDQYWEFTLCTLVEWVQFLSENKGNLCNDVHMQALAISVFELSFEAAQIFSASFEEGQISSEITSVGLVTEKAKTEWSEFFAEGVFSPLLPMFVSLATTRERWDPALWTLIQAPLSSVVSLCPGWLVLTHQLPPHLTASDTSSLSDSIKTLLNHLCPLLMSRENFVELAAYFILRKAIEEIAIQDSKANETEDEEETKSPPEALIIQLEAAAHFLEFLKVGQVGEHIVLNEGTEDMSQAMGFLLLWRLLLFLFKSSPDELRAKYAQYFKAQGSVSCLLDYLFRLMPQYPDPAMVESSTELKLNENFQGEPIKQLEWLSVQVYRDCLEILPALVRTWWMEQDRRSSNFVDRFTTQYLSTGLIWQQIASSQSNDDNKIEGITIKSRPAAREVLATYEMAEVTINMTITLPENFPLGKLDVACDRRVGVSQAQWDRWLLQLNIFLQHQNGSIVEGLRLWKGNIDKKFEGLDDCMICFSVIHGTTLQLPRLSCRTCRKKFHSTCLYKWFSTSQKSSCPLCRNLF